MTNLKLKIEWNEKPDTSKGYSILSVPYNFTVELSREKTETFNKYGDQKMLNMWAEQIIKLQYPKYDGELISVTKI